LLRGSKDETSIDFKIITRGHSKILLQRGGVAIFIKSISAYYWDLGSGLTLSGTEFNFSFVVCVVWRSILVLSDRATQISP